MTRSSQPDRPHILTVAVEDYFQATALGSLVSEGQWSRFESRVPDNTRRALDLLDTYDTRATFFVLGWVAERFPSVVAEIAERGHEVASKGYYHRPLDAFDAQSFRDDLRKTRAALERATGLEVIGHRVAQGSFGVDDTWALDILTEEGFRYDSSFYPRWRSIASQPWRRFPHVHRHGGRELMEMPMSTWGTDDFLLPAAGGNYFRQLPTRLVLRVVADWARMYESPFVAYFHVWELDPDPPLITAARRLTRIRQYRNLDRMPELVRSLLERYRFRSVAAHLEEPIGPVTEPTRRPVSVGPACPSQPRPAGRPVPVTLVVPCYNEQLILPYLANTLRELEDVFRGGYELRYVFVDDGSRDKTLQTLHRLFGARPDTQILRHRQNRGIAAAVMTGVRAAQTEIVAIIDCDCTYDPRQLAQLIPMLDEDTAMVTASPYHPLGGVKNVPAWRLFLSRSASRLYRHVLHHQFETYTSCFRVLRRSRVESLALKHEDFLGVVEMLAQLDLQGAKIVECPAVLETRLMGVSKMKTARAIGGHLRLMAELYGRRLAARRSRP